MLDPQIWDALQTRSCTSIADTVMEDIHQGKKYKELEEFTSCGNLTLLVNTDGVQLFRSSTVSMWPVWLAINELPISMRYIYISVHACN